MPVNSCHSCHSRLDSAVQPLQKRSAQRNTASTGGVQSERWWYNGVYRGAYERGEVEKIMASEFLGQFIALLFQILSLAILGRVLLSWVDPMGNMRITQVLHNLTEPMLAPVRSLLPSTPMFDFSPIIVMLLLNVLSTLIADALIVR
jgi:YggT family protein